MGGKGGAQGIFNSGLDFPRALPGLAISTAGHFYRESLARERGSQWDGRPSFFLLIPFRPIRAPVGPRNLSVHLPKWEVREVHRIFLIQASTSPVPSRDSQSRLRVIFIGNRSLVKGVLNGTREKCFIMGRGVRLIIYVREIRRSKGERPSFFLLISFRPIRAPVGPRNLSVHLSKWEEREGIFNSNPDFPQCLPGTHFYRESLAREKGFQWDERENTSSWVGVGVERKEYAVEIFSTVMAHLSTVTLS
ncbi:hypothetical protein CDAR_64001 [Caerostris darwini]|uniref:Uncharacterized protein n=1 Tax=Caerostris darwini TaxID=1538125 RepID=A0AAV4PL05_9ARAC|nr:hypothetical protein CDAR_64001 [Caerostris darwini]